MNKLFSYQWLFALFAAILAFVGSSLQAQETNYWGTQIGAKSSLIGGAVTGSVNDNSAVFYNPARLSRVSKSNINISADIYSVDGIFVQNGAGDGINLSRTWLSISPQFFSGGFRLKKAKNTMINYTVFNVMDKRYKFKSQTSLNADIVEAINGNELYNGLYDFKISVREDWVGFGFGVALNDKLSLGLSNFFTVRHHEYFEGIETNALSYDLSADDYELIGNANYKKDVDHLHIGNLFKVGLAYELQTVKFGLSITTPRLTIPIGSKTSIERSTTIDVTGVPSSKYHIFNERADSEYESPWIIDLGVEFSIKQSKLSLRSAWFSEIDPYKMSESYTPVNTVNRILYPANSNYSEIYSSHESIVNFAIGYESPLSENTTALFGFRTDYSYNSDELSSTGLWSPYFSYWDVYHLSSGLIFTTKKYDDIIFGLSYAFGSSSGDLQRVNLSDPVDKLGMVGVPTDNTKTIYNQLSIILGLTFNLYPED